MEKPKTMRRYGKVQTSVLISIEFYELCKKYDIRFSEALRVGVSLLLADKGIKEYDNDLNLFRKMLLVQKNLEEVSSKYYSLLEKAKEKGLEISPEVSINNTN